jgi:hypothetical protein
MAEPKGWPIVWVAISQAAAPSARPWARVKKPARVPAVSHTTPMRMPACASALASPSDRFLAALWL